MKYRSHFLWDFSLLLRLQKCFVTRTRQDSRGLCLGALGLRSMYCSQEVTGCGGWVQAIVYQASSLETGHLWFSVTMVTQGLYLACHVPELEKESRYIISHIQVQYRQERTLKILPEFKSWVQTPGIVGSLLIGRMPMQDLPCDLFFPELPIHNVSFIFIFIVYVYAYVYACV